MADFNPYARFGLDSPASAPPAEPLGGVWRDDKLLVMRKDAVLPDRCVKCNAPANGRRLQRSFWWHDSKYFALGHLHPLIYVVVALFVRQTAKIELGICRRHYRKRLRGMALGWTLFLLGVGAIGTVAAQPPRNETLQVVLVLSAVFFIWGGPICAALFFAVVRSRWMDKEHVWLTGIDPGYLAQFPPVTNRTENSPT